MMDFLGDLLEPHQELLGKLASSVTLIQFLSGVFLLNDIRKKSTSEGFTFIPFIGGSVLSIILIKFGTLIRDEATIKVNIFGFALNVVYVCIYYFYTPQKSKTKVWGKIGLGGIFAIGCIAYTEFENPELVELRFGILLTVILVALVGSPLLGLPEILRTKNSESLPFPIIFSGFIVSCSWLAYGFAIRNSIIVIQNVILGTLGLIQLGLIASYPKKLKKLETTASKKKSE